MHLIVKSHSSTQQDKLECGGYAYKINSSKREHIAYSQMQHVCSKIFESQGF